MLMVHIVGLDVFVGFDEVMELVDSVAIELVLIDSCFATEKYIHFWIQIDIVNVMLADSSLICIRVVKHIAQ